MPAALAASRSAETNSPSIVSAICDSSSALWLSGGESHQKFRECDQLGASAARFFDQTERFAEIVFFVGGRLDLGDSGFAHVSVECVD